MLEDNEKLNDIANKFQPDIIIHLAAQAGVRYSLENPRAYINSNIVGTFNVMEIAKKHKVKHLLIASTSSVYGANSKMPFTEIEKADTQLTIYSATKKACESMAHSYSYLWKVPTTIFRFFTVYGPWGRPDMALFKFVSAILNNKPIDIYNNGNMYRDFTYIDDLVHGIKLLIDVIPSIDKNISNADSLSSVAPYRVVNIGNSNKVT
jgi:UDP-glucuronate 4-epimerase